MKLLYFAWMREKIGCAEEERTLPANVATVAALLDWLETLGAGYAAALGQRKLVRVAVNGVAVAPETTLKGDEEVAIFPPVTGGAQ